MHHPRHILIAAAAGLIVAAACSDTPITSTPTRPEFARVRGSAPDVRAVRMDLPPRARPWDTSDVALSAMIAAEDGNAIIGIKETGSARALATGLRAAVTGVTVSGAMAMLRARGVQILHVYDAFGALHVRIDPALAAELRHNPLVDYIEPRQWRKIQGIPGVDLLAFLPLGTAQTIPWGIQLVQAPNAWTITRGTGAKLYLIDTGMDTTHEDLPHPPADHCGGSFDGCADAYPIPHGTHVMGIWTARDNSVGVVGVAPGVNPTDVYLWGACDSNSGACSTTDIVNGLNASVFDADVINMSFGGTAYDAGEANAVAFAWSNNIVLVAAAGNNGGNTLMYPANYTNVIGVSGVQPDKSFASTSPCSGGSSNYGSDVDLAAPFWALSTVPGGYDDETGGWCGTSMATPHVSGAAALVRALHPTWTNQQIVTQLFNTAEDLGPAGRDDQFGYGLVNAAAAVGYVPPPPPFYVTPSAPGQVTVKGTYPLTGSASDPASGWTWERSDNGAPYQLWSNSQNTAFVAYAGTYSISWRLIASRNSDGKVDTAYAATRVCIPYNPATCEPN